MELFLSAYFPSLCSLFPVITTLALAKMYSDCIASEPEIEPIRSTTRVIPPHANYTRTPIDNIMPNRSRLKSNKQTELKSTWIASYNMSK